MPARPAAGRNRTAESGIVVAYAPREVVRARLRAALARTHRRGVLARSHRDFSAAFGAHFVDTALVEVAADGDGHESAELAREYPSVPFLALTPFRPVDAPAIARCAELDFADVLADGTDDGALAHALATHAFTVRFATALDAPPPGLALTSPLQVAAWRAIVAHGGRPVATAQVARALRVTREHLSRSFPAGGAPTLKRAIDFVRLLAAGELAKNPGYDLSAVARLVGFASAAKLSASLQRLVRAQGRSLSALRATDLLERFVRG